MNVEIIIARCTRDGHVAWSQVARQLGRSVDSVRAQHDPSYLRAYVWAPSREADPDLEPPVDENDTSSPHVRQAPIRDRILHLLAVQTASAQTLALALNTTVGCAKVNLSRLAQSGMVRHDRSYPYTWELTIIGRSEIGVTRQANTSAPRVRA